MQVCAGRAGESIALPVPLDVVFSGGAPPSRIKCRLRRRRCRSSRCAKINGVIEVFAPTKPARRRIRCRYDRHSVGTAPGRYRARAFGGCRSNRLRTTFRWKADDLDAAGLAVRVGASSLTLGGLLKHMAMNGGLHVSTSQTDGRTRWLNRGNRRGTAPDDWGVHVRRRRTPPEQLYASWKEVRLSNGPA